MPKNPEEKEKNRADRERNSELIQEKVAEFVKEHSKMPSYTKVKELTGLSMKTVREHMKRLKFKPKKSVARILTPNVIAGIYKRATGYEEDAIHFSTFEGMVTQTPYTKVIAPDPTAAKLFLQVVEGFSEKTETQHSGSVGFNFNYVVPQAEPQPESSND